MVPKILLVFVVVGENYRLARRGLLYPYGGQVLPDSLRHGVVGLLFVARTLLRVVILVGIVLHFLFTFLSSVIVGLVDELLLVGWPLCRVCWIDLFLVDHFFGAFLILRSLLGRAF